MTNFEPLLKAARELAQTHHAQYDPSHDFHHIERVVRTALYLAKRIDSSSSSESSSFTANRTPVGNDPEKGIDLLTIELSALFHDLLDKKYQPITTKGSTPLNASQLLSTFWQLNGIGFELERKRLVENIIEHVSYSKQVQRIRNGSDADKLDAIGAFGIMRCSAYSAITNRPLYISPLDNNNTKEETDDDSKRGGSAIDHFDEKLFKLEGMMKTKKGKELARKRTELMKFFVQEVERESNEVRE